jgi:uncharacterized membrane protein YeaQ/YmgE (transglycosylase-associated protein family)
MFAARDLWPSRSPPGFPSLRIVDFARLEVLSQAPRKTIENNARIVHIAIEVWRLGNPRRLFMHIIWSLIIGLIVGAIAKLLMPGRDPGGFIVTMLLGVAGSLLATWLGRAVGFYPPGANAGFIMSILGAIVLLGIYRFFYHERGHTVT